MNKDRAGELSKAAAGKAQEQAAKPAGTGEKIHDSSKEVSNKTPNAVGDAKKVFEKFHREQVRKRALPVPRLRIGMPLYAVMHRPFAIGV
jgi:hypothetical protein